MNIKPIELKNSVKGEYAIEVYGSEGNLKSTTGIQRNAIVDKYKGYKTYLDARVAKATELGQSDLSKMIETTLYNASSAPSNELLYDYNSGTGILVGKSSNSQYISLSSIVYQTKQEYVDDLPNHNTFLTSYGDATITVGSSTDDFEEYSSGVNEPLLTIKDLNPSTEVPSTMKNGTVWSAFIEETCETIYTCVRYIQATEDCTITEVALGPLAHSKIKDQSGYATSVDITPNDFVKIIYRLVFANNVNDIITNKANYLTDVKILGEGASEGPDIERLLPKYSTGTSDILGAAYFTLRSFLMHTDMSLNIGKAMDENDYKSGISYLSAISKTLSDFLLTDKSKDDCVNELKTTFEAFSAFLGENPSIATSATGIIALTYSRQGANKNIETLVVTAYYSAITSEANYVTNPIKMRLPIIPPSTLKITDGIKPSFGSTPVTILMYQPNGDALYRNYISKADNHYYVPVPQIDIVYTAPYAANIYNWNLIYTETLDLFNTKYQETSNVAP